MRNTTIAIIATLSVLFAVPAQAATKSSKQEVIGVGSGALIGAAAGGPVGFIIGAAVGAKIGDTFHRKGCDQMLSSGPPHSAPVSGWTKATKST